MADHLNRDEEELISFDDDDSSPQPVPVPPPGAGPQPVPVPPPKAKPIEDDTPIALVDMDEDEHHEESHDMKKVSGAAARGLTHKVQFKREVNVTGQGATRFRMFYSKIADGPLLHMENMINEWIDDEGIEVKHVGQVIGTLEGKRAEPNLIITVWY